MQPPWVPAASMGPAVAAVLEQPVLQLCSVQLCQHCSVSRQGKPACNTARMRGLTDAFLATRAQIYQHQVHVGAIRLHTDSHVAWFDVPMHHAHGVQHSQPLHRQHTVKHAA